MSQNWHFLQSAHNKKTSDYLATTDSQYYDWAITTLFYSSLHLINEYFTQKGIHIPQKHNVRNSRIEKFLPDIFDDYYNLFMLAIRTRYAVSFRDIEFDELQTALNSWAEIKAYLDEIV